MISRTSLATVAGLTVPRGTGAISIDIRQRWLRRGRQKRGGMRSTPEEPIVPLRIHVDPCRAARLDAHDASRGVPVHALIGLVAAGVRRVGRPTPR